MSKRITQIVLILGLIAMVVAACSFATGTDSDDSNTESTAAVVDVTEVEVAEETTENTTATDSTEPAASVDTFAEAATDETAGEETVYTVSTADSEIGWLGDKIVGNELYGSIDVLEGSLVADGDAFVSGSVTIDMTSMVSENLTGSDAERLITHLQTEDFFSVDIYPTATIALTTVEPLLGNDEYAVTGDLTIKGITNPIEFTAQAAEEDGLVTATADVVFDRTLYDVTYKSGSIFSGLGDGAINDEVQMTVSLVATAG